MSPPRGVSRQKDKSRECGALSIRETSANGSTSEEGNSSRVCQSRHLPLPNYLFRTEAGPASPCHGLAFRCSQLSVRLLSAPFPFMHSKFPFLPRKNGRIRRPPAPAAACRRGGGGVEALAAAAGAMSAHLPLRVRRKRDKTVFLGVGKCHLGSYTQGPFWIWPR